MKDGRIHIRVEKKIADRMKKYAEEHHTTVSAIVEQYFVRLLHEDLMSKDAEQL